MPLEDRLPCIWPLAGWTGWLFDGLFLMPELVRILLTPWERDGCSLAKDVDCLDCRSGLTACRDWFENDRVLEAVWYWALLFYWLSFFY